MCRSGSVLPGNHKKTDVCSRWLNMYSTKYEVPEGLSAKPMDDAAVSSIYWKGLSLEPAPHGHCRLAELDVIQDHAWMHVSEEGKFLSV